MREPLNLSWIAFSTSSESCTNSCQSTINSFGTPVEYNCRARAFVWSRVRPIFTRPGMAGLSMTYTCATFRSRLLTFLPLQRELGRRKPDNLMVHLTASGVEVWTKSWPVADTRKLAIPKSCLCGQSKSMISDASNQELQDRDSLSFWASLNGALDRRKIADFNVPTRCARRPVYETGSPSNGRNILRIQGRPTGISRIKAFPLIRSFKAHISREGRLQRNPGQTMFFLCRN
jgi:hypothetical protein